jgi:hypothetical protein
MKIKINLSVEDEDRIVLNALNSYRSHLIINYDQALKQDKAHDKKAIKALDFLIKDFGG